MIGVNVFIFSFLLLALIVFGAGLYFYNELRLSEDFKSIMLVCAAVILFFSVWFGYLLG